MQEYKNCQTQKNSSKYFEASKNLCQPIRVA